MGTGKSNGFTLIELMVALAVLAILVTVAVPSFTRIMASNRVTTEINAFIGALQFARSAAIQNGANSVVCASTNSSSCSGAGPWDTGWIVFLDLDGDGTVDADDELLRVHGPFGNGDSMTGNTNVKHTIAFGRSGMLASLGGIGTVTLQAANNATALQRCVVLPVTGNVRSESGTDCNP